MRLIVEKNLMVPMRDGVKLATDVYRPDVSEAVPTLVQRVPYNKEHTLELIRKLHFRLYRKRLRRGFGISSWKF
jgi:predicted acyl esterase